MRNATLLSIFALSVVLLPCCKSQETAGKPAAAAGPVEAVFYEFYKETCKHCIKMMPVVEKFEKEHAAKFKEFRKLDITTPDGAELFHEYDVSGTPTFLITDAHGKEVDRVSGVLSYETLVQFMENTLAFMRR